MITESQNNGPLFLDESLEPRFESISKPQHPWVKHSSSRPDSAPEWTCSPIKPAQPPILSHRKYPHYSPQRPKHPRTPAHTTLAVPPIRLRIFILKSTRFSPTAAIWTNCTMDSTRLRPRINALDRKGFRAGSGIAVFTPPPCKLAFSLCSPLLKRRRLSGDFHPHRPCLPWVFNSQFSSQFSGGIKFFLEIIVQWLIEYSTELTGKYCCSPHPLL